MGYTAWSKGNQEGPYNRNSKVSAVRDQQQSATDLFGGKEHPLKNKDNCIYSFVKTNQPITSRQVGWCKQKKNKKVAA